LINEERQTNKTISLLQPSLWKDSLSFAVILRNISTNEVKKLRIADTKSVIEKSSSQ